MRLNPSVRTILNFDGESSIYNYIGEAATGASITDPVWKIYRLEYTGTGSINKRWADGSDLYNKIWVDRVTYTY